MKRHVILPNKRLFVPKKPAALRIWDEEALEYCEGGGGLITAGTLDPATIAWVAAVVANGGTVSGGRQTTVDNLIIGLKSDGIWTQLDRVWILAAENNIAARTDLVGLILAGGAGAPPFVIDRGYTGSDNATAVDYLDCTSSSVPGVNLSQFALNSCHVSAWCVTNNAPANGGALMGGGNTPTTTTSGIYATFSDGNVYARINDNPQSGSQGSPGTRIGHWIVSRTGASTSTVYQNGSSFSTPNQAAGGSFASHSNFIILGQNSTAGGAQHGTPNQVAMASIGAGLSSADATKFYNRLRTYMTAVGVP